MAPHEQQSPAPSGTHVLSVTGLVSTYCFVEAPGGLAQVVWLEVASSEPTDAEAWLEGPGLSCPVRWRGRLAAGEGRRAEIAVLVAGGTKPGTTLAVEAVLSAPGLAEARLPGELEVREPGWAMYMVSHFHYDPVWWNTQAGYTSGWDELAWAQDVRDTFQHTGLVLVEAHLERARLDPDYKFVLAEVDYLKPFWDLYPDRRQELRQLLADGRLEVVGGTYNEPNTNLTAFETAVRCAVYGMGFQRDVFGARPETAWQLDVFGHDPSFPAIMAACGVTSSSWARGPFHQWGPKHHTGSTAWMQFPSEFEWVGPDGTGLFTSYMADHYSAGWQLDLAPGLEQATQRAYDLFCDLAAVSATKATLLPVGTDYTPPNKWVTELARAWSARYASPKFVPAVPREFFAAVRAELAEQGRAPSPQTRDMGPVYTGKDVSFIDTKQAHRMAETALVEAEKLATFALALGHPYPHRAADKAWRQLVFNSHHDGITGSESDQVYLDLLGGWREAHELALGMRGAAVSALASQVSTWARSVVVFNSLGTRRSGLASAVVPLPEPGAMGVVVRDAAGREVPAITTPIAFYGDGTLSEARVELLAEAVPGLGYRCYSVEADSRPTAGWEPLAGATVSNERYRVEADAARGGGLSSIVDRLSGREFLLPGELGNELLVYPEYPTHPNMNEGPWHLMPAGPPARSSGAPARVQAERSVLGERLVVEGELDGMAYTQVVTLLSGHRRVELRAVLDGFSGHDRLVRLRFPLAVPAGTPLAEVGNAVIARSWGFADQDSAEAPWTLDTPAQNWAGVGATMVAHFVDGHAQVGAQALGVGEVVVPDAVMGGPLGSGVRSLLVALVQKGVTASCTEAGANRYGNLLGDSNLPDFRISLGKPEENHVTAAALHAGGPGFEAELERQLARDGAARLWVPASRSLAEAWAPDLDLRAAGDLGVLVVAGVDEAATGRALAALVEDVENGQIVVDQPATLLGLSGGGAVPRAAGCTAAVLNRGTPGFAVDSAGAMYISLLRSCTGWPSGVWIDPPRRTAPDGSNFELEHWSHVFDHALVAGEGDWRSVGCVQEAHDFNTPLLTTVVGPQQGVLPPAGSLLRVSGGGPEDRGSVVLSALKPAGNPLAAGRLPGKRARNCPLEITARLYESAGSPATAILRAGESWELDGAWAMNLLEEGEDRLPVVEGQVVVGLSPAQTRTVRLRLHRAGQEAVGGDGSSGMARAGSDEAGDDQVEVAQPVFSRYWLHNKGPAPMGNQLLAVHLGPTSVRARAGSGETALVATVSSGAAEATQAGRVQIIAPDNWDADPPSRLFNLAAGAYTTVPVRLVVPERTRPGRYFVAARVEDGAGQSQEDVATIDILPSVALNHPAGRPAEPAPSFGHPSAQAAAELEARLTSDHLRVVAGSTAVVGLILTNRTRSELRGEAQLVSPWETWALAGPWVQGFSVPPGGQSRVDLTVSVPAGSPPLSSWLLVKVMYFGRLWYSPAVRLDVTPLRRAGGGRP